MRELKHFAHGFNKCQLKLVDPKMITIGDVASDWALSPDLCEVLTCLSTLQQKNKRQENLIKALCALRNQIKIHKD